MKTRRLRAGRKKDFEDRIEKGGIAFGVEVTVEKEDIVNGLEAQAEREDQNTGVENEIVAAMIALEVGVEKGGKREEELAVAGLGVERGDIVAVVGAEARKG